MSNKSLHIILNQYRQKNITEEEAINLIEDLYDKSNNWTYPYYPPISYESIPCKYEVVCKYDS